MNTQDTSANHETEFEGLEAFELGNVSEETRGALGGFTFDGGIGRKY